MIDAPEPAAPQQQRPGVADELYEPTQVAYYRRAGHEQHVGDQTGAALAAAARPSCSAVAIEGRRSDRAMPARARELSRLKSGVVVVRPHAAKLGEISCQRAVRSHGRSDENTRDA
jgi:hypothetical protein